MLRVTLKRLFSEFDGLAAKNLTPLKKGDPKARIPVYVDGKRVFPPVIDPKGVITYHYEFDQGWRPYTFNYSGHGWLILSQVLLWWGVWKYDEDMEELTEKSRS